MTNFGVCRIPKVENLTSRELRKPVILKRCVMNRREAAISWLQGLLLAAVLLLFLPVGNAGAADTIPPGTVVNFSNWQNYQDNMTVGMVTLFKGDHFWSFPKNAEINVGPTVPIGRPKLYIENTEKYGNQTRMQPLSDGGYTVTNYTAGAPFPDPLSEKNPDLIGQEIHYDAYYRPQARTEFAPNCTTAVDRYGNMTRTSDTNVVFTQMTHLSSPTYPVDIPDNGGYYRAAYIEQTAPEQGKYTASLLLAPNEPTKISELYAFIPSLRRSLRLSEAARCAPLYGSDFTWEDLDGGPPGLPQLFKIKYLKSMKLLALVHQNPKAYHSCGTATGLPPEFYENAGKQVLSFPTKASGDWELRDAFVIEYSRLPQFATGYCYGKRVLYIDKDSLFPLAFDLYDSGGKLYKMILLFNLVVDIPNTQDHLLTLAPAAGYAVNFQDEHASTYIGTVPCIDHDCDGGGWTDIGRYATADGLMKIAQ
jgi:hypothetical protein